MDRCAQETIAEKKQNKTKEKQTNKQQNKAKQNKTKQKNPPIVFYNIKSFERYQYNNNNNSKDLILS